MFRLAPSSCYSSTDALALSCGRRPALLIGLGLLGALVLALAGCDSGPSASGSGSDGFDDGLTQSCTIPTSNLADGGVPKDGIPALTDPAFVGPDAASARYLADDSRVIGLVVDGQAYAVPHNILWHHEIANLNFESVQLAVTYCPLTGSSLAFDRAAVDGAAFGVSGLLFNNNLVMYDRTDQESLWPQMNRTAGCGPRTGRALAMYPVTETTWAGWQALHPATRVVSSQTGFDRLYQPSGYPYGDYERLNNDRLLFSVPLDERRPPKERVLGVPGLSAPDQEGGTAYPFGELDDGTPVTVVNDAVSGTPIVVLWSQAAGGAMAFEPVVDGQATTFEERNEQIVDAATGSVWTVDGRAISGPQAGARLTPIAQAYVAFWFAWATFQPQTTIYRR